MANPHPIKERHQPLHSMTLQAHRHLAKQATPNLLHVSHL